MISMKYSTTCIKIDNNSVTYIIESQGAVHQSLTFTYHEHQIIMGIYSDYW